MDQDNTATTFCGTPEYIAPEMLNQKPYTKAVDWWSFGILLYEMMIGIPPFYDENTNKMYQAILNAPVKFPPGEISDSAQDLILGLLERTPTSRLGSGPADFEEIKEHDFFSELNWDMVMKRQVVPEWKPTIASEDDTSHFDAVFTEERPTGHLEEADALIAPGTQSAFKGFTCVAESKL
jgi:serine/threonine protein kinase